MWGHSSFKHAGAAAVLAFAIAPSAFAIRGVYLNDRDFPSNVCKIGFFTSGSTREPDQLCSGTLIAKNRLITAAHCDLNFEQHPDAYVKCGADSGIAGWNFSTMVKGHIRTPWYTPEGKLHDLAVFELAGEFAAPAVAIVESLQQSRDIQAHLENCRIFGFGRDNFNRLGVSHGAQFQTAPTMDHPFVVVTGPNRAAPGDSGGPVLCPVTANGTTRWIQLAVTVSIPADQTRQTSFHELLENHLEWLRGVQGMSELPKIRR